MQDQFLLDVDSAAINKLFEHSDELRKKSNKLFISMNLQSKKLQRVLTRSQQVCEAAFKARFEDRS